MLKPQEICHGIGTPGSCGYVSHPASGGPPGRGGPLVGRGSLIPKSHPVFPDAIALGITSCLCGHVDLPS